MQKEKQIQIKCHSQVSVSAIPTLALFRSSSRRVSMRDIAKQLYPGLRHSGMTSNFNSPLIRTSSTFPLDREGAPLPGGRGKSAFTLIELLVVVLIIGILAAIAVPQYQKAVEKSKASQALTLLKAISEACDSYYLEHGKHASSFSQLDLAFPWTGTEPGGTYAIDDTRSNGEWSIQLYNSINNNQGNSISVQIERIKGKYRGAGFTINKLPGADSKPKCYERKKEGYDFKPSPGEYCVKLFHGTGGEGANIRAYQLP